MFLKTTGKYLSSYEILYYDEANSRYLWTYGGNNALTAAVGHPIKLRYDTGGSWSSSLLPTGYAYNEHEYYTTTISSVPYYVWWSPTLNWVISKYLGYGTNEYQESTVWKGDYWWNGANLTGTTGSPTIFNKRGAGKQAANNKKDSQSSHGVKVF